MTFNIQEELKKLPDTPGVYLHKDEFGQIIYVGKAISLKRRVSSYFRQPEKHSPKTRELVKHIVEFEYINCGSELEALILECNLIKKYRPKYNILLRDDKTYPYIKLTLAEEYPRVMKTRRLVNDGSKYFGPYADVSAVNTIIDLINSVFALKRCNAKAFPKDFKPCLDYHIHQCKGVCKGNVSKEEYRSCLDEVVDFLQGKSSNILRQLKEKMNQASEEMRFEDAATYRDQIEAAKALFEKQRVVLTSGENLDIILTLGGIAGDHALLFTVREGKLSGRESFFLGERSDGEASSHILAEFIKRYYSEEVMIPKEILVKENPVDVELLEEWLSEKGQRKVKIYTPQRGDKKALMDVVLQDARIMLSDIDERTHRRIERDEKVFAGLCDVFGTELAEKLHRIESYDISNTFGVDSVGAMVVFEDGRPLKKAYRRFRVKTVEGPDDTGSLTEVLFRRFRNAVEKTPGFEVLPDILFMDGGAGQISAAEAVLKALKLDIPVAGMVKDDHHRTRALLYKGTEYPLKGKTELFAYVGAIQEEVHRFAIEYHRNSRDKSMTKSVLDQIEGIGPKRRAALLEHFGSVEEIKRADFEALCAVLSRDAALAVYNYFNK